MIHITDDDYRQLAMMIEDASYGYDGCFEDCIEYDTDRFNSDLKVEVFSYDEENDDKGLFISFASMETSKPDGREENDFNLNILRNHIS